MASDLPHRRLSLCSGQDYTRVIAKPAKQAFAKANHPVEPMEKRPSLSTMSASFQLHGSLTQRADGADWRICDGQDRLSTVLISLHGTCRAGKQFLSCLAVIRKAGNSEA